MRPGRSLVHFLNRFWAFAPTEIRDGEEPRDARRHETAVLY